jgi:hypothetical protein
MVRQATSSCARCIPTRLGSMDLGTGLIAATGRLIESHDDGLRLGARRLWRHLRAFGAGPPPLRLRGGGNGAGSLGYHPKTRRISRGPSDFFASNGDLAAGGASFVLAGVF